VCKALGVGYRHSQGDSEVIGVSRILSKLIKNYGLETRVLEYSLRLRWKQIVGERIAAHTVISRIQHRRLYLWVDSPVWVNQLTLLKPELLQKINGHLRNPVFKDIILRGGHPPLTASDPPQADQASDRTRLASSQDPSPELELCIQEYLKPLEDSGLKEVLRRVMIKSFTAWPP